MQYFKQLNLDDQVVIEKLQNFIMKHQAHLSSVWESLDINWVCNEIPELAELFPGLTFQHLYVISVPSGNGFIHRDGGLYQSRINIPIFNCNFSTTKYFTSTATGEMRYLPNGRSFIYFDPESCTEVAKISLTQTTLLNVQELHQVCVDQGIKGNRVVLSIGFNESIEHLWDSGPA